MEDKKTPFISAASVFGDGFGLGSVSGIVGASAFLDMYGSALSALDDELAGSKSKYYSRESAANKDAELREVQERAIAEQIREVEELARQQVELEMNPMLNSW